MLHRRRRASFTLACRLLAQCMDHVPVVNDVTTLAVRDGLAPPERHHGRRAQEAVEPIVVEVHAQPITDQPRRRGVENTAQNEAAARRDRDELLFVVGGAPLRQRSKPGPFQLDPFAIVGIPPADDLVDEAAVGTSDRRSHGCYAAAARLRALS